VLCRAISEGLAMLGANQLYSKAAHA
jgi:hypothetical protein